MPVSMLWTPRAQGERNEGVSVEGRVPVRWWRNHPAARGSYRHPVVSSLNRKHDATWSFTRPHACMNA